MKTNGIIIVIGVMVLLASSCKPFYQCGETRPEKVRASKRVKAVLEERDELCKTVEMKNKEISELKEDISILNEENDALRENLSDARKRNAELDKKYNDLMNENLSQSEQFTIAMQQKTAELEAKERLLRERENTLNELQEMLARQDSITKRLNDIIRNALLGFQSDELSVEVKNGKVYVSMSDKLLFRSGSAAIEDKGKEAIKVLAEVLKKNPDIDILVEGHTDNVPIRTAVYRDNWDLSVARATSIVRILTDDYNIKPTRLTASGRGEFSPRASNETAEGKAMNRRTEIILSPKLEEIMQLLN